jgi:hypothetical protein
MTEQKIYNINGVDFKQCPDYPRFFVSKEGSYFTKVKGVFGPIKEGVKNFNKQGYPLQAMVCTGEHYITKKGKRAIKVINLGKLVLLTWVGEDTSVDSKGYPRNEVDHINRNPFDNRLDNLRWASRNENQQNRKKPVNMDNPYWCFTPEARAKAVQTRKERNNYQTPTWLNTPEMIEKRRKAIHEAAERRRQEKQNETESC